MSWAKMIRPESSIRCLLSGAFTHPTVNDFVAVGTCSLRFFTAYDVEMRMVSRYDHDGVINAAAVMQLDGKSTVCFLADRKTLCIAVPSIGSFVVVKRVDLDEEFTTMSCGKGVVCLSSFDSLVRIVDFNGDGSDFVVPMASRDAIVLSTAFIGEFVVTVTGRKKLQINVYVIQDGGEHRLVARHAPIGFDPYVAVAVPSHNSVYVLGEGRIVRVQRRNDGAWLFPTIDVPKVNGERLVVDVAPMGRMVLLALLESGVVVRIEETQCKEVANIANAEAIVSLTIAKFVVATESCRLRLLDREFAHMDEFDDATCGLVSYSMGTFVTGSKSIIHSVRYDCGIEMDQMATVRFGRRPMVFSNSDVIFVSLFSGTVVLDRKFQNITPSYFRGRCYSRFHGNSGTFFFGISDKEVTIFDHGSINTFPLSSTLSAHRNFTLFLSEGVDLSSHMYCHGTLVRQNYVRLGSQVTALGTLDNGSLLVAMLDGVIYLMDGDFIVDFRSRVEDVVVSLVGASSNILVGTTSGDVLFLDHELKQVRTVTLGNSPAIIHVVNNQVSVLCDDRYHFLSFTGAITILPPDFQYFAPIGHGQMNFVALVMTDKIDEQQLITFEFTDRTEGFHTTALCECHNGRLTCINCSQSTGNFAAAVMDDWHTPTLYFSHGEAKLVLSRDEDVSGICEWRAFLGPKLLRFWIVCTNVIGSGLLYIISQSKGSGKATISLKKSFPEPINAVSVVSRYLACIVKDNAIVGISLASGALKGGYTVRSRSVVALDSTESCIVALHNEVNRVEGDDGKQRRIFSMYSVDDDSGFKHVYTARNDAILTGRIKIIGEYVVITSRVNPVAYIYQAMDGQLLRTWGLCSPVTAIFNINGKAVCCGICGEVHVMDCSGKPLGEQEVSRLFSFGNFSFAGT